MEKIKFSIIVPVYNVELYLVECLESLCFQTYSNYEVICINDASTDNSYEILLEYQKKSEKIQVISNTENRGLSYSRNKGVEIASGEYILFVDSDDYISLDTLRVLYTALDTQDIDIVIFNFDYQKGSLYDLEKIMENDKNDLSLLISGQQYLIRNKNDLSMIATAWTKLYKRTFLIEKNFLFYENLLYEDVLYSMQVLLEAKYVLKINTSLYYYRKRKNSITTTVKEYQLDSFVVVLSELLNLWKNSELEDGMDLVFYQYMNTMLLHIKRYMLYFPEHKILSIGNADVQFLFNLIQATKGMEIHRYVSLNEENFNLIKKFKKIVIYGAGNVATELIECFYKYNIDIFGIAVSNKDINVSKMGNYEVKQIEEYLEYRKDALVIVAVLSENQKPIKNRLMKLGFKNVLYLNTNKTDNFIK